MISIGKYNSLDFRYETQSSTEGFVNLARSEISLSSWGKGLNSMFSLSEHAWQIAWFCVHEYHQAFFSLQFIIFSFKAHEDK